MENSYLKFIHADDFGMSHSVSKTILDCIQNGSINSVSVMMVQDRKYFNELKQSGVKIKLHLNLTSYPTYYFKESEKLPKDLNFFKLLFLNNKHKETVLKEIKAQIDDFSNFFQFDAIAIDGHHHIQTIPWIYNHFHELNDKNITEVRVSREKIFIDNIKSLINPRFYRNLTATLLLKFISQGLNNEYKFTPEFYGLLYSGIHDESTIRKVINKNIKNSIELTLHPGLISEDDQTNMHWRDFDYYFTKYRKEDYKIAKSELFKDLI